MMQQFMMDFVDDAEMMHSNNWKDDYSILTSDPETFMFQVQKTDQNTEWMPEIPSKTLSVALTTLTNGVGSMTELENVQTGTGLSLNVGTDHYPISEIGRQSLYNTAKIKGSALGRLSLESLRDVLNECLKVSNSETLLLLRYGKIMAMHTDKYVIMPMTHLCEVTRTELEARFGRVDFLEGFHSNDFTKVIWSLPNFQNDFMEAYYDAIDQEGLTTKAINLMPVVRFTASDTATSAVTATPMALVPQGYCLPFVKGISVRHEHRTNGFEGIALYQDQLADIFAKFDDMTKVIKHMATVEIENPVNCLIGICNALNQRRTMISKKYADAALEELKYWMFSQDVITMYDIFLCMGECIHAAKEVETSMMVINTIEEAIALIPKMKWSNYDIGGVVAWRR